MTDRQETLRERCANCGLASVAVGPPCPKCGSKTSNIGEIDLMSPANKTLLGRDPFLDLAAEYARLPSKRTP